MVEDRIAEIRRRVGIYKSQPCGPTRRLMIEDFDYLLETVDRIFALAQRQGEAIKKQDDLLYRKGQELERRLTRIEQQQDQDDIDWLLVTGQLKWSEHDDRSVCY